MSAKQSIKVGVIGAGSWGTTLALLLHRSGHQVTLWEFRPEAAKEMSLRRENYEFLPGIELPEAMNITSDLTAAISDKDMILLVIPSHVLRSVLEQISPAKIGDAVVVTATKGIETDTLLRMSEVIHNVWDDFPRERIVIFSGPSLSGEVNAGIPTTVVAACESIGTAQWVQRIFSAPRFRVYASDDVTGVELGGALKNVMAIAAGISDGLGFGDNAKGALLTRGLSEIKRLGLKMGGKEKTFSGLSGMGDLITTCVSNLSRNHTVGYKLGKGLTLHDILGGMLMVAEGVNTTKAALKLSKKMGVEMPIVEAVNSILFEGKPPKVAVSELMLRELKIED